MQVRPAQVSDAEAVGLVNAQAWRGAYAGLMPQDYLDALDPAERGRAWRRRLESIQPPTSVLVLERGTEGVVGFASLGPARDPDADPSATGEVMAIYLLPEHWRGGGGRVLMAEAVRRLSDAGFREATLWVLETNDRARRFYEAVGWSLDGQRRVDESYGFALAEVRYRRSLD
ncbi:MAG TPA: GNAT family N-acetyltransferase [Micromonosporaceae bacterium]|jgi:GNAT superfamily N-acetyltransferase